MTEALVLNLGPPLDPPPEGDIAAFLRGEINQLKGEFYALERGGVDYAAMGSSPAFARYTAAAALLRDYDLPRLASRQEQLAFWINLYNTLVIHGVVALQIRDSVKEEAHFFSKIAYRIGGLDFSPDAIEHGILRNNHRPPYGLFRPFSAADPRQNCVVHPPDPRIHFALVCASSSCPPINVYTPEGIDVQLDLAAAGFINGPEVEILPEQNLLRLSPIFKWYQYDFGGYAGVIDTLTRHIDPGPLWEFLTERGLGAEVEWQDYDWSLNR